MNKISSGVLSSYRSVACVAKRGLGYTSDMFAFTKDSPINRLVSARAIGIGIFFLAFALRLCFAIQWHNLPYGGVPLGDAADHDDWAMKILQGHFLKSPAFYSSPLYPYFLALTYKLFGHSFFMVSIVNALIDSLTCVLLGIIAFDCFGAGAAIITGLLAVFCRSMIFYTAPVMKESLGLFLLAASTLMLLRALRNGKGRDFAFGGFCLGLCALVRGNALLLIPLVPGFIFLRRKLLPAPLKNAAIFVVAVLLAIMPATLHNFIASRDFVLINYDDGYNLFVGNSPWATGIFYDHPSFIIADSRSEEAAETLIARQATGNQKMSPSAVSGYWRGQALTFIAENPVHTLSLLCVKFLAFWNTDQQVDNYDAPFIERNFPTLLSGPTTSLWLIAPLAVFAAVGLWPTRRKEIAFLMALAATYMVSVLSFYVVDRYRLPIIIFMLPLAGAAMPTALKFADAGGKARSADGVLGPARFSCSA